MPEDSVGGLPGAFSPGMQKAGLGDILRWQSLADPKAWLILPSEWSGSGKCQRGPGDWAAPPRWAKIGCPKAEVQ